jgi:hypothetical protein
MEFIVTRGKDPVKWISTESRQRKMLRETNLMSRQIPVGLPFQRRFDSCHRNVESFLKTSKKILVRSLLMYKRVKVFVQKTFV